jgi:hypothetical protein
VYDRINLPLVVANIVAGMLQQKEDYLQIEWFHFQMEYRYTLLHP